MLGIDSALLLLAVCRNLVTFFRKSSLNKVFNFQENLYLHRWTAYAMLFFTLLHVNAHYFNFFIVQFQLTQAGLGTAADIHYKSWAGSTGHIMLLVMFIMYTAANQNVKTKKFELFWYSHHLFVVFYLCMFFHAFGCFVKSADTGQCKSYNTNYYLVPVFVFYVGERLWRMWRSGRPTEITGVVFHPGNTIEIRFLKPSFSYLPGQYLFVNIPAISKFQWHPYTISSTPEEHFISVHIRIVGDWTTKLANLLQKNKDKNYTVFPNLKVDGPYGAPAQDLYNYKHAMLIGAGIGVTPAASLLKSVWYRYFHKRPMKLQKLYFYWLSRDSQSFSWFQSLLSSLEQTVPTSKLEIHTYLTGTKPLEDVQNISYNYDNENDPITMLKSRTEYGRPEWSRVFKHVRDTSKGEVGVFYCGSKPLAKQLEKECDENSTRKCRFVMKKERF